MQHVRDINILVIASSTEKIKCATIFVQDSVNDGNENSVQAEDNNLFIDDMASDADDDDDDDDDDDGDDDDDDGDGDGDDDDDDDDDDDVAEEIPRKTGNQEKKNTIKLIDSFALLHRSLDSLSSVLEDSDKRDLDDYLKYKCLSKFRSKEEVDLLYEGRVRTEAELRQLMNEKVRNHIPFNKLTDISPTDTNGYRNKISTIFTLQRWNRCGKIEQKNL